MQELRTSLRIKLLNNGDSRLSTSPLDLDIFFWGSSEEKNNQEDSIPEVEPFHCSSLETDLLDEIPVHCATFGASLPEELNDDNYYFECIQMVTALPDLYSDEEIEIELGNVEFILGHNTEAQQLTTSERIQAYTRTFTAMARKGFWSYDRFHHPHKEPEDDSNAYILIAHPKKEAISDKGILEIPLFGCHSLRLISDYTSLIR